MARLSTTADVFNAIAEPQRRSILELLVDGERSVNEIAEALNLNQPQTSKHLRVLHEVELVDVRQEGRHRIYQLQSESLKPIHDWVRQFEALWNTRFDRLDAYLQSLQTGETTHEQRKPADGTSI
ncbi:MAG: winged helix-turn-helix transcriptional regulator [Caldilineaceae bacterium]|nr:winged helix-turn-helix transcriptional regulator [Caldilineaceae bacterium]MCB9157411.1 winged helix-turn-helix transcriptional regulator [Caldilineaceae bacterium]